MAVSKKPAASGQPPAASRSHEALPMSIQLIQQYHNKVERLIRYGGTRKETTVRKPFMDLLEQYARPRNLELVPEVEYRTRSGHTVYPDGTLKDALRQDWQSLRKERGYW